MKYNININQKAMQDNGITLNQWLILDVISTASIWCDPIQKDGEIYFWIARQRIAEEITAIKLASDTVYRHLKKLSEMGFIDYEKVGKKDAVRLSKKGKGLFTSTMSEMKHEHYVGNETQNTMSEAAPTDHIYSYNNNAASELQQEFEMLWKDYQQVMKAEGRRGGTKSKALGKFMKLRKKYSLEEIQHTVTVEKSLKLGRRDLENVLVQESVLEASSVSMDNSLNNRVARGELYFG